VVVRPGLADAERIAADIASLLHLATSTIRIGGEVPLGADVAVVLGKPS